MKTQNQTSTIQCRKNTEPLFWSGHISGSESVDPDDESNSNHLNNHICGHFGWITDFAVSLNWDCINKKDGTVLSVVATDEHDYLIITTCFYPEAGPFPETTLTNLWLLSNMSDDFRNHFHRFINRNRFFFNRISSIR